MALLGSGTGAAVAQAQVKEKPPLYTYFASWQIPRAHWAEIDKANQADEKILDQAVSSGSLVAYGDDAAVLHQADGSTQDNWWSATSIAALLDALESLSKGAPPPVLATATKHSDAIFESKFYNWHAGTYKGAYTHTAYYKLKADAPDDAVAIISKAFVVPLMEKLLADGTIVEYEVDEEAIHSEAPDAFWIDYITATSAGIDKVNAALDSAFTANPLTGPALGSMVDLKLHRDYLSRGTVTYK
jgi:hypothetical protein